MMSLQKCPREGDSGSVWNLPASVLASTDLTDMAYQDLCSKNALSLIHASIVDVIIISPLLSIHNMSISSPARIFKSGTVGSAVRFSFGRCSQSSLHFHAPRDQTMTPAEPMVLVHAHCDDDRPLSTALAIFRRILYTRPIISRRVMLFSLFLQVSFVQR